MQDFRHFLITRINLGYLERNKDKFINISEWLDYRFEIFYQTCFESVINQSIQNFIWLIYIDARTPVKIVNELKIKISKYPNFVLQFKEGDFDAISKHVQNDLKYFIKESRYLITSRVDSDDFLHQEYIANVQSFFDFQDYLSINFTYGWIHDLKTGLLGKFKNRSNPFISLIEKIDNDQTILSVFHQSHTEYLFEKDRIEVLDKRRLWCMNIHSVNDSTKFKGNPVYFIPSKLNQEFNYVFKNDGSFLFKVGYSYAYLQRQLRKLLRIIKSRFYE